ncbi:MAG: flagellar hook-length control protein FliK, partial [Rhodospirillaceae bacterium]
NFGQLFSSSEQSVNNVFDKLNGFALKGENTIDLSRFIDNEITADSDSREPARNVFSKFAENISSTLGGIIQTNKPGHYKFTTSLYPENLGALEVNIEYSEEYGIKINLVGENLKAVQIMQENAAALKNSINVADSLELNISLNDAKDENDSSQAFAGDQEFSDTGKNHQNDLIVESDEVTELGVNISSPYSIDRLI